jgi:hypothetical protein
MGHSCKCTANFLPGRPAGCRVLTFPTDRRQIGEGVIVVFDCGAEWIGDFEPAFGRLTAIEYLNNHTFAVIAGGAGYLVQAALESCQDLPGLITARILRPAGLICATQTHVLLCTHAGVLWRRLVSTDGVSLLRATDEAVVCLGWDASTDTLYEFQISIGDGALLTREARSGPV